MAHDVFISFSSKDKTIADAVCAILEGQRIRCWIAPRDITAGVPFAASLVKAISDSRVFVLVLSGDSNHSKHVLREVGEAVDNGIPIIPFRIDNIEPSEEMRYYIKSIHWLDAMDPPLEQHMNALAETVLSLLSVGEDRLPERVAPRVEAPAVKRRSFPVWMIALFALMILIIAVLGGWIYTQQRSGPSNVEVGTLKTPETQDADRNVETTESDLLIAITEGAASNTVDEEWRYLKFIPAISSQWRQTGENSYTALAQNTENVFAWSDEIVEGDFVLEFDISFQDPPEEGVVIVVYGDGWDYAYGSLLFVIKPYGFSIMKHNANDDENFLADQAYQLDFDVRSPRVTIEVSDDRATLYIDSRKVLSAPIDNEVSRSGKIALNKFWIEPAEVTFSNIRIKTLNE